MTVTSMSQGPHIISIAKPSSPSMDGHPVAQHANQAHNEVASKPGDVNKVGQTSALAHTAADKLDLIKDYIERHAGNKLRHNNFCYRHHPAHSNLLPDKYTLEKMQKELSTLPKDDCEVISHMWNLFGTASGRQRQIIMQGMLSQCCFPQLSDVTSTTKELLRIDFIASLPIELAFKVLRYLDAKSLCMASMVSKTWKSLADDDVAWYHLCEQHIDRKCTTCGWGLPLLERTRLRQSKGAVMRRLENFSANSQFQQQEQSDSRPEYSEERSTLGKRTHVDQEVGAPASKQACERTRPWKDVYVERFKIEQNWRLGKCVVKDFLHPAPVLSLQFDEQYLITGTCDGMVSIWSVETKRLVRQLRGHIRGVSALKFDSNKLVTGSWDQSVRVWNYRTGQCLCTFGGHESKILCIDFDSNLIAAGSADATIKIWDFVTKSCFTLRGHRAPVHSVRIHKASNTLFTSSEDLTVRMWCLNSKKCIRIFGGPENGPLAHVAQIQYALPVTLEHLEGETESDHHILVAPTDEHEALVAPQPASPTTQISNDDVQRFSSRESNTLEENSDPERALRPTHLLTASLDNTIKVWDIRTGKCARTLFGHIEGVWSIAADNFRIVSGGQDKLVKVWDIQSGKCWHTYSGHTKAVCSVGLTDTGFASGGDDGLVRLHLFDI